MTDPYTPEKVAELVAESRERAKFLLALDEVEAHFDGRQQNILADALTAVSAERDAALAKAENGSCWDDGPQMRTPGGCDPMPPKCELRAGHAGAHRGGNAEWMRNPASYNHVAAERDRLHKAITEALAEPNEFDWDVPPSAKRILRVALDKGEKR